MAIEIGKLWRELPADEKRTAQENSLREREEYKRALAKYKNSEDYIKYERYIKDWRAKKPVQKGGKDFFSRLPPV